MLYEHISNLWPCFVDAQALQGQKNEWCKLYMQGVDAFGCFCPPTLIQRVEAGVQGALCYPDPSWHKERMSLQGAKSWANSNFESTKWSHSLFYFRGYLTGCPIFNVDFRTSICNCCIFEPFLSVSHLFATNYDDLNKFLQFSADLSGKPQTVRDV